MTEGGALPAITQRKIAALRETAKGVSALGGKHWDCWQGHGPALDRFLNECNPSTILALLDQLAAAERRAETDAATIAEAEARVAIRDGELSAKTVIIGQLEAKIAAQSERIKALEEGLKPFAREAEEWDASMPDETLVSISSDDDEDQPDIARFNVADLRTARTLLETDHDA